MRRLALTWMVTLVVAACGVTGPPPSASPSAAAAPIGWSDKEWGDPPLRVALPGDWDAVFPFPTTDPAAMASLLPDQRKSADWFNRMVASGSVRLFAGGSIATSSGSFDGGSIVVVVESGDDSLTAFADRSIRELNDQLGVRLSQVARSPVVVPFGAAERLEYSVDAIGDWPAFVETDYLVRLADGRSLTVSISGIDQAASNKIVTEFAGRVISTLSARIP